MKSAVAGETRPFIKFVGGKHKLVPEIVKRMPSKYGTYFEPFVGGGALFFALQPKKAILSDLNAKLIATYVAVRDRVELVIGVLKHMPHDRDVFVAARKRNFEVGNSAMKAADFIYCNKTGFNGMYRVNGSGQFNIPFGKYKNPTICDEPALLAASTALKHAQLIAGDFDTIVRKYVSEGDFIFVDPPYAPTSETSNFTGYTSNGFDEELQVKLRDLLLEVRSCGISFVLTNSDTPLIRKLYDPKKVHVDQMQEARSINSDGDGRGKIGTLMIWWKP